MKYFAPLFVILFAANTLIGQTVHRIWEYPIIQGVAAQVENRIITFEELRREMAPLLPRLQQESRTKEEFDQKMSDLYLETVQSLIDRYLIVKEFVEKKYNFPSSVVENEYDRILIEDFNNDRAAFHEHLQSLGKNAREFRSELRERIIVSAMRSNMHKSISEISPARIETYYDQNKIQFFLEESIHLRLIMLKPIGDESPDLMRQQAERILAEVDAGKSFEDAAKTYSQDTRRSRGGDWGWVTRKDLNEKLADLAFSLGVGKHSEPILVGNQIYLMFVEERRPEGIQPLAEVRDQIEDILAGQLSRQVQQAWIERLRQKAFIRYY
ncbi:MAG: peptidyl-prolyl cis-trans isomerase [Opitutales bacterium]|jgi:peptidyl-prolyl cis-trans isomerase SurA